MLYAYEAQNDDELTIKEGDVIVILTKEVEDKGWWKGELNGRVGVFPDNFVKLIKEEVRQWPRESLLTTALLYDTRIENVALLLV